MTERAPPSRGARFRVNPRRRMTPAALVALMIVAGVGLSSAPASAQDKKPNIVFILADNIGYGDIGVYAGGELRGDRKSTRLNSSHVAISYAVFCLKKKIYLTLIGLAYGEPTARVAHPPP